MSKIIELQPREINSIGGGKKIDVLAYELRFDAKVAILGLLTAIVLEAVKERPQDDNNFHHPRLVPAGVFTGLAAGIALLTWVHLRGASIDNTNKGKKE